MAAMPNLQFSTKSITNSTLETCMQLCKNNFGSAKVDHFDMNIPRFDIPGLTVFL